MKFKFRLETVLKHRKTLRDLAQKDLGQAEFVLQEHFNFIDSLYKKIDDSRQQSSGENKKPSMNLFFLNNTENYILSIQGKIKVARNQSRELIRIVEEKRDALVEKAKEFKAIELLKEKQFKEFQLELNKKEQKEQDDLIQMRFKKEKAS